jgi:hypothetical protein
MFIWWSLYLHKLLIDEESYEEPNEDPEVEAEAFAMICRRKNITQYSMFFLIYMFSLILQLVICFS